MTSKPAEVLTLLVGAVLALLIAFGVNLTDDQIAAIVGFFGVLPLVITLIVDYNRAHKSQA